MRRSLGSVLLAACGASAHPRPAACGQPVTLGGQDDVAAIAACERVGAVTLRSAEKLDTTVLRVREVAGDLTIGPSVGLEEATFPQLASIAGTLHVAANSNLHGIYLPNLARAGAIDIDGNAALATISLPRLAEVTGALSVTANPSLELLDLSALAHAASETIARNHEAVVIERRPAP
jgi:hypothetical protein